MHVIPVLIPSYNPNEQLIKVVHALTSLSVNNIVIVNDGSDKECEHIFEALSHLKQCHVIHHAVNLGKGRALKTGFNYISLNFPNYWGIVTADGDGQHTPTDIIKVSDAMLKPGFGLILGARVFSKDVPLRSYLGNVITRYVFRVLIGQKLTDTQTGLRGIPPKIVPFLISLKGERYEYETNMLIAARELNIEITEIHIQTVYLNENQSSHFNPFFDSIKIYFLLLRFLFSSISTSFIDFVFFGAMLFFTNSIFTSIFLARIVAGTFNFAVNKMFVFKSKGDLLKTYLKYFTLVFALGFIAYLAITYVHTKWIYNIFLAKVTVESLLFLASFAIQRDFIFTRKQEE